MISVNSVKRIRQSANMTLCILCLGGSGGSAYVAAWRHRNEAAWRGGMGMAAAACK